VNYFPSSRLKKFPTFIIFVETPAFSSISSRSIPVDYPKLFKAFIAAA